MKGYKQLSYKQRCYIYILFKSNLSQRQIASKVGVNQSTISREFKRNSGGSGYFSDQAQGFHLLRQIHARKASKMTPMLRQIIRRKLRARWSPEQISGWLKEETSFSISHERIYQYVYSNRAEGGNLYKYLRRRGKKYSCYSRPKGYAGTIKNRVSIDERPKIVDRKSRVGDWEIDTILGRNYKGAIVTIVERKTKFTLAASVENLASNTVINASIELLKPFKHAVHTITADNGREFAYHEKLSKALKAKVYFCHPYCSHERGLNENTNGLLRQYWPKGRYFTDLEHGEVRKVVRQLNRRPRKTLQYKTPEALMTKHMNKITLNTFDALQT